MFGSQRLSSGQIRQVFTGTSAANLAYLLIFGKLGSMADKFGDELLAAYPNLKIFALSLTSNKADADDLVQATIERALERRSQFHGGSLIAWVITIAKNLYTDEKKSAYARSRDSNYMDESVLMDEAAASNPEASAYLSQVVEIIEGLGGRCKELLLFSAQGYKTREIAEWLKIPSGTAMRNMFECKHKLHVAMNSGG